MRRSALIFFLALSVGYAKAQSTNISTIFQSSFRKAELMYNQQGYRNAIDLYQIVLDRDPLNRTAKMRVADCYYRLGRFEEASRWYKDLVSHGPADPEEYYQLGQVQCALEHYDSAKAAFEECLKLNTAEKRALSKITFIQNMKSFRKDSSTYSINREWYNSQEADFSPRHYNDGIVFVSSRDRDLFIKRRSFSGMTDNEAFLNAYYVGQSNDTTKTAEEQVTLFYSKALNSPYHDGPVTFYDNGKKIAFTRNILKNGKPVVDELGRINLELYFASLGEQRLLTNLERFSFNNPDYSIAHPWVSEDGLTLLFASNMPGGFGGADLYVCYFKDQQWTKPENLGASINTAGDEYSPFLWNGNLLLYSSNGLGGFGGLDNFVSTMRNGKYELPRNLGYPLNTSRDDFGLIVDASGAEGYFASNRIGNNDDVYSFTVLKVTLAGHVREQVSRLPVPEATVTVTDDQNKTVRQVMTDDDGNFSVDLDIKKPYTIGSSKEGYTSLEERHFYTEKAALTSDTLSVPLWKNGLFVKGKVYSNELQAILPNATVFLINTVTGAKDSMKCSPDGEYNFLVLPNKTYRVWARHPGYLEKGFNLNTKALYAGNLVNDILLEEVYQEKLVVQFDYDKWNVRPEYVNGLNKIVRSLNRFKFATLYVGAHADSRGTREYNKVLSDKRAAAVVAFLKERNINVKRIQAFGFGEELILNTCSDGVECTDEEHSKNRRAEIKVQLDADN